MARQTCNLREHDNVRGEIWFGIGFFLEKWVSKIFINGLERSRKSASQYLNGDVELKPHGKFLNDFLFGNYKKNDDVGTKSTRCYSK